MLYCGNSDSSFSDFDEDGITSSEYQSQLCEEDRVVKVKGFKTKKKQTSKRNRPTLRTKKNIVYEYYNFIKTHRTFFVSTNLMSYVGEYVEMRNTNPSFAHQTPLIPTNLTHWIRAERRGEYRSWSDINDLDSSACKIIQIIRHIDLVLKQKFPCHAYYNQVSKSKSTPNEYGVIARRFTPAGTFLGFYKGEVINGPEASDRIESQEYMFALMTNNFIDAKAFDSCFARYYKCALKASDQNVWVERVPSNDCQKVICFIANKDINKGEEFLISFASACGKQIAVTSSAVANIAFCSVQSALMDDLPEKHETLEPLFSAVAPTLAAEFCSSIYNKGVAIRK
jgi:hypothetical protein